jgi:hypothetical protein
MTSDVLISILEGAALIVVIILAIKIGLRKAGL